MNPEESESFRERLLALQAELQRLASSSLASTRPVELDQSTVGRVSRMDAIQAQQMARESARRRESHLVRIGGALLRIETGEFGFCHVCREEIDHRRLESDPTVTRCVECQGRDGG